MNTKEDLMAILEYFIMDPDAKESWKDDNMLSGDLNPRRRGALFFFTALSFFRGMNCPVELGPSLQVLHVPWIAKKLKIRQLGIGFCSFDWSKSWKDDNTLSGDFNPRRWSVLFFFTVSRSCVFSGE